MENRGNHAPHVAGAVDNERAYPVNYRIKDLDIQKGIGSFDGNAEIYFEVLRSFAANTRPLLKTLHEAIVDKPESYSNVVHGIKGSSRSVNAEAIGNRAEAIETAAASGDFDFVRENIPAFISVLEALLTSIEDMFVKTDMPKVKIERPDRSLLAKLLRACREHDMDGAYDAISGLTRYEYHSGGELIDWLKERMDRFKLKDIVKKLDRMDTMEEG
jgi:HPt (histidine-containing phosphotransfer) domain-containing protein